MNRPLAPLDSGGSGMQALVSRFENRKRNTGGSVPEGDPDRHADMYGVR